MIINPNIPLKFKNLKNAAREVKFGVARCEQDEAQHNPSTPLERQKMYEEIAHKVIRAYCND